MAIFLFRQIKKSFIHLFSLLTNSQNRDKARPPSMIASLMSGHSRHATGRLVETLLRFTGVVQPFRYYSLKLQNVIASIDNFHRQRVWNLALRLFHMMPRLLFVPISASTPRSFPGHMVQKKLVSTRSLHNNDSVLTYSYQYQRLSIICSGMKGCWSSSVDFEWSMDSWLYEVRFLITR